MALPFGPDRGFGVPPAGPSQGSGFTGTGLSNPGFGYAAGANNLGQMSNFSDVYSAFLKPLLGMFGGTNYGHWLGGSGQGQIQDLFNAFQQNAIAQGTSPAQMTTDPQYGALAFLKGLNPLGDVFNKMSPQARGEDPSSYSPFTRFFGG